MASRPTSAISDNCAKRARFVSQYVTRMEKRCNADPDKNLVFGGAYVSYIAFFEAQLEALFVGLLTGALVHPNSSVQPVVTFKTTRAAKGIVFGGKNYVDWLPFDTHTVQRASVFYKDGLPFSGLSHTRRQVLMRSSTLRNAIAHQSDHSLRQFDKHFVAGKAIPVQQRRPNSYLRGQFSLTQTRFQVQIGELVQTMNELCI